LPPNWQNDWRNYTFQQLSVAVLSLYISPEEINQSELTDLVDRSYKTFRHPEVTPLRKVDKTWILELFHGPTFAFKDVALQLLGNLFEFFLKRKNAKKGHGEKKDILTIIGATSGDTGRCISPHIPCFF
jgi:threonine synthase